MIIARHNYEEYFLMYVDNELTAGERAEVELFAQQNPDLAAELDILMQTKLTTDDTLVFGNKKGLLQNTDTININNYEEQFLLYIDRELDATENRSVEKFVLQHPQFQDEFTLLKQAVLEPEAVIFEDKESLLREEERRVIPMFLRFAAAAAIIGIAVLVWWMKDNSTITPQIAVQQNIDSATNNIAVVPEEKTEKILPETTASEQPDEDKNKVTVSVTAQTVQQKKDKALVNDQQKSTIKQDAAVVPLVAQNDNTIAAYNSDATHDNDITKEILSSIDKNTSASITEEESDQHYIDNALRYAKNTDASNSKYTKNALYKELNTDEEESNSLYLGSMQINKNKVRGFMKKVGGLFAGKSKDGNANEDGKLQVANLELNTN
ncbi:hypothetical protein BH10BAC2_BH10BAC2_49360 [soil metagenome]